MRRRRSPHCLAPILPRLRPIDRASGARTAASRAADRASARLRRSAPAIRPRPEGARELAVGLAATGVRSEGQATGCCHERFSRLRPAIAAKQPGSMPSRPPGSRRRQSDARCERSPAGLGPGNSPAPRRCLRFGRAAIIGGARPISHQPDCRPAGCNPRSEARRPVAQALAGGVCPLVAAPPSLRAASAMPIRAAPPNTMSMPTSRPIAQAAVEGRPA